MPKKFSSREFEYQLMLIIEQNLDESVKEEGPIIKRQFLITEIQQIHSLVFAFLGKTRLLLHHNGNKLASFSVAKNRSSRGK